MMTGTAKRVRLGDLLVEKGFVTQTQLDQALDLQRQSGRRLGEIIVDAGFVPGGVISQILAEQAGLPYSHLHKSLVDTQIIDAIPREKAQMYEVMPLFRVRDMLTVAISDPNKAFVIDTLKKICNCDIQPAVAPREDILEMINECYGDGDILIDDFLAKAGASDIEVVPANATGAQDISQMAGESPVISPDFSGE